MNPYFEQQILGADPLELVRLLYQRTIACVSDAREHLQAGRIEQRSRAVSNAYAALGELLSSLHLERAPELAARLRDLYAYMQQRLLEANFQQTDPPLSEVLALLSTLAEAWVPNETRERTHEAPHTRSATSWSAPSLSGEPGQIAVSA